MRFLILGLLFALPAVAQPYPGLFDVTGVATDDVLNIREEPNTDSPIIGEFYPNQTGIEVIAIDGNWGQVNVSEQSGWVSMSYLAANAETRDIPAIMQAYSCYGTEPFWSLTHTPDSFVYFNGLFNETTLSFSNPQTHIPSGYVPRNSILTASNDSMRMTAFVQLESCNDGMSDRRYGMSINLLIEIASPSASKIDPSVYALQGCCSISPP